MGASAVGTTTCFLPRLYFLIPDCYVWLLVIRVVLVLIHLYCFGMSRSGSVLCPLAAVRRLFIVPCASQPLILGQSSGSPSSVLTCSSCHKCDEQIWRNASDHRLIDIMITPWGIVLRLGVLRIKMPTPWSSWCKITYNWDIVYSKIIPPWRACASTRNFVTFVRLFLM